MTGGEVLLLRPEATVLGFLCRRSNDALHSPSVRLINSHVCLGGEICVDSCAGRYRNAHESLDSRLLCCCFFVLLEVRFDVIVRHWHFVESANNFSLFAVDSEWNTEEAEDGLLGFLLECVDACLMHFIDIRCFVWNNCSKDGSRRWWRSDSWSAK
mgnify:CR=1 FL=1